MLAREIKWVEQRDELLPLPTEHEKIEAGNMKESHHEQTRK
jgi:hypothetical protein